MHVLFSTFSAHSGIYCFGLACEALAAASQGVQ
jgi:hypothetical protein